MKQLFSIIAAMVFTIFFQSMYAQNIQSLDTIKPPLHYENIYLRNIANDSLSSSFVIFIKNEVKLHKHLTHTEQVIVLDGEAEMTLGEKKMKIKKGDIILIPQNTPHSVKVNSKKPLKVLSVQSPYFDGKDRIFVEN